MRSKIIELTKTLLLIALTCSAIYLTIVANSYYNLKLPFIDSKGEESAAVTGVNTVSEASKPVKMAVMNSYGRYAAIYSSDSVEQMYDSLGKYLGEALGTMGQAEAVQPETVMEKLSLQGIFYEFPGRIHLSALAAWLGAGLPSAAEDPAAEMFVISLDDSGETLCYRTDDGWHSCRIELRDDIAADMDIYRPNNVSFAFELARTESSFDDIEGFCLIDNQPAPPAITAQPMTAQLRETVASYLGFNPYSDSSYIEDNGDEVFTANNSMLRLETGGLLTFNAPGNGTRSISAADRVELARSALMELVSPGEARLYFAGEEYENGAYTLNFDYYVSGIRVITGSGSGAQVVVESGKITRMTVWLRSYAKTDSVESLLPAVQAAAMKDGRLEVVYTDNGADTLTAGWTAE
ncbi:MAG: hypothetical protein E7430_02535 [Ruminococcaceae bacterium]|nr:hypothetical protein [Oscillospiraceae bacterium]